MLNEAGALLSGRVTQARPSRNPGERLLAGALDSLTWLSSCALAFVFTVDERGLVDPGTVHSAAGHDRREASALVARLRQLEAIDPFSPRRAAACRASLMSVTDVGGPDAYARSMHGQRLCRFGWGAPLVLYLWRADRIVAGITLLPALDAPPLDAATVELLRQVQPLLEDALGLAAEPRPSAAKPAVLTAREGEVARLVGRVASNAVIAGTLHVREVTVKSHLTKIYAKARRPHANPARAPARRPLHDGEPWLS